MAACDDMVALILGAAEDTLDAPGRARLRLHVEGCDACRAALALQTSMRRILAGTELPPVSAGFAARLRERLEPRPTWFDRANWRGWTLRLAPVAALLGALAVWPGRSDASLGSLSAATRTWAAGASAETQLALDPSADASALISAALGDTSR